MQTQWSSTDSYDEALVSLIHVIELQAALYNQTNWRHNSSSAGHFRKPVRKSATCGLKVLVCVFANRFLSANICGKNLKSTANQQYHWDRFCNFHKNTFLRFNTSTDLGECISNVQHLSPRSSAVERLFPRGAAILTVKWVGLRSRFKKLPMACFCEGKLELFEVAKGCPRWLWWHAQHV